MLILSLLLCSWTTRAVVISEKKFVDSNSIMQTKTMRVKNQNVNPPIRCWERSANSGGDSPASELFEGSSASSSSSSPHELFDELAESTTCAVCAPPRIQKQERDPSLPDDRYHAVLVFPENAPEFIPLATGLLLTNRFRVTILRLHFESEERRVNELWDEAERKNNNVETSTSTSGEQQRQKMGETHERTVTGIPCNHSVRVRDDASYVLEVDFSMKEQNRFSAAGDKTKCQGPISLQPFDSCAIQAAPGTSLLIKNYIPLSDPRLPSGGTNEGKYPDVMITDASLVGALWMSEAWGVPIVAVASHSFVPLAVEHDAAWTGQGGGSWLKRLWRLLGQRLHSLSITSAFMEMNKMRVDSGLPPLRRPIDYFGPVAAILMEFAPVDSIPGVDSDKAQHSFAETTEQWERIHVMGPLQPPCFPCDINKSKQNQQQQQQSTTLLKSLRDKQSSTPPNKIPKILTVLVVPPSKSTPIWTRNILQGIFLARESLIRYDDCDWDSLSCQKHMAFKTVWLYKEGEEDYFPAVIRDHVERESYTSLLDSVANHPGTLVAIMPCDKHAAIFEKSLAISVICIEATERFPLRPDQAPPSADNPRELSAKILQQLRARQQKEQRNPPMTTSTTTTEKPTDDSESSSTSPEGSLTRAVSIIQRVAEVHRQNYPWKDMAEMQRVTSQAVKNLTQQKAQNMSPTTSFSVEDEFDWQTPYDTFTVLVAWIVVLASIVYIAVNEFSSRSSIRGRSSHNNHGPSASASSSVSDNGLFTRPDLDDAWAALLEWYNDQPDSLQLVFKSIVIGASSSSVSTPDPPHHDGPASPQNTSGQNNRRRKKR